MSPLATLIRDLDREMTSAHSGNYTINSHSTTVTTCRQFSVMFLLHWVYHLDYCSRKVLKLYD